MKGLAITSKGVEETASLEIKELINADCRIEECCVVFEFKKFDELCLLCYKSQSADRILYLLGEFEFDDFFENFKKFINEAEFGEWPDRNKKFRVECIRLGMHNFKSVDVEKKAAELITKKLKSKNLKIDLKDYEIIFFAYVVNNRCYFGIDFAGFELNKRQYKIFLHPNSLRGTIAYSLVRESGFQKKEVMLDPFSRDGVIPIEAAFYANDFPVNYYKKDRFAFLKLKLGIGFDKFFQAADKKIKKNKAKIYGSDHMFKYVDFSKKNAKIAGMDKLINFSRIELEWLDIKFKKESIDRVIANPPVSKNADLDKIYNEFFYQCSYILKKKGIVALISTLPELAKKHAEKHGFAVSKEKEVWSGAQLLKIIVFKKKSI